MDPDHDMPNLKLTQVNIACRYCCGKMKKVACLDVSTKKGLLLPGRLCPNGQLTAQFLVSACSMTCYWGERGPSRQSVQLDSTFLTVLHTEISTEPSTPEQAVFLHSRPAQETDLMLEYAECFLTHQSVGMQANRAIMYVFDDTPVFPKMHGLHRMWSLDCQKY